MLYLWQSNRFIYLDSIFNSKYFGDLAFTFQTIDKGRISKDLHEREIESVSSLAFGGVIVDPAE